MKRQMKKRLVSWLMIVCLLCSIPVGKVNAEQLITERATTEAVMAEEATVEELVTEEATVEESVTEEATVEESVSEEATVEESVTEATVEESVTEEATVEESVTEEVTVEESVTEGTTVEELVTEDTTTTEESVIEETTVEEVTTEVFPYDFVPEVVSEEELLQAAAYQRTVIPQDGTRYTVLALDTSGSMSGTAMRVAKEAGIKFCESVLDTEGTNYVSIVTLNSYSNTVCQFTNDIDTLKASISAMYASGGTNVEDALATAGEILEQVEADAIKNIVILSDGLPEYGKYKIDGRYTYSDHYYSYAYANAAYETATELKKEYYIYTLGFFHSMGEYSRTFGTKFMTDLQNAGYYEVIDANDLIFTFGEIAEEIKALKKKGTFEFASGSEEDFSATYYYDDMYFMQSAYTYNPSLATMSICLAMSAFGSNDARNATDKPDYSNYSQNVEQLLSDIGYENIKTNEYYNIKPKLDSIGVIAGHKKIVQDEDTYTLIAAAVRGGGYESEWGSNFTIGTSGEHQGFREAKQNVLKFLKSYIEEQQIEGNIKLWITGYSRAAATTNLTAAALDNNAATLLGGNVSLAPENLYAYCFETPQGALSANANESVYENIHSVINPNDLVPKVAMTKLGFLQYGSKHILPTKETDKDYYTKRSKMLEFYNQLESTKTYVVDDFQMKKISLVNITLDWFIKGNKLDAIVDDRKNNWSLRRFLDEFLNATVKDIVKTRINYVDEYQDSIREVCSIVFGSILSDPVKMDAFKNAVIEEIEPALGLIVCYILVGETSNAVTTLENVIVKAANDVEITDLETSQVNEMALDLLDIIGKVVILHPNYTVTLGMNLGSIGEAHYPELCYAWLCSQDRNYTDESLEWDSNGDYRIIHINCPVDVTVYNSDKELIAQIVNDEPIAIEGRENLASITLDGVKEVVLPVNESYTVTMTATDEGLVNYAIKEFSLEAGEVVRVMNYYDMPVQAGDVLVATVAEVDDKVLEETTVNGTNTVYTVLNQKGEVVEPNNELCGEMATEAYYYVSVSVNKENAGVAIGSGSRQLGSFAQMEAVALEGHEFLGWYENGVLLSSESVYRIRVEQDRDIVAVFDEVDINSGKPSDTNQSNHSNHANTSSASNNKPSSGKTESNKLELTEESTEEVRTEETVILETEVPKKDNTIDKPEQVVQGTVIEEATESASEECMTEMVEAETQVMVAESEASEEQTQIEDETVAQVGNMEEIEETQSNWLVYMLLVVVAMGILGCVLYLLHGKKKEV